MHSFYKDTESYSVARYDYNGGRTTIIKNISFASAIKMVNYLNGGNSDFDEHRIKVMETCIAK